MTVRSGMSSTMGVIRPVQLELYALELEKWLHFTLFTLYHLQLLINRHQTWSEYT